MVSIVFLCMHILNLGVALKMQSSLSSTIPSDLKHHPCRSSLAVEMQNPQFSYWPTIKGYPQLRAKVGLDLDEIGYNILPSRRNNLYEILPNNTLRTDMNLESEVLEVHCEFSTSPGQYTTIQRVGPFHSYGGYDFWELAWENGGHMDNALSKYKSKKLFINGFRAFPVTEEGTFLGLPPIHIHHVHVWGDQKFQNVSFVRAGDGQCISHGADPACLTTQFPSSYGVRITKSGFFEACLNDVRNANSTPLKWWHNVAIDWIVEDSTPLKPVSYLLMNNAWKFYNSYTVRTDESSMMWWTTTMERPGTLVEGYNHCHMAIAHHSYLFAASSDQLGLDQIPRAKNPWEPITLKQTGFSSLEELTNHIFVNLKKSNDHNSLCTDQSCDVTLSTTAKLLCSRPRLLEEVDGFLYDRTIPKQCSSWTFRKGDPVTGVFFNQPLDNRCLGIELVRNRSVILNDFQQHSAWMLYYVADDLSSHYEYNHYSQTPGVDGANWQNFFS